MADKTKLEDQLAKFKGQFETFRNATIIARSLSERDQDYDDHQQWTEAEIEELEARDQAPVVINLIKPKINLLTGIQRVQRTKPKALPRTPKHEDGADAITEALRFVTENNDFDMLSSAVFREEAVPGYGGAITEIVERGGESWVAIRKIPWDRYWYDHHSRELDFSDKDHDGIWVWMDVGDIKAGWPDKKKDVDIMFSETLSGDETFDDKPLWVDNKRKRARVCEYYFKDKGWKRAFFTEQIFLEEPHDSPYKDEFGEPTNPIEMQTAYINRDLQRYGEARSYIWPQDEANHRRSRLLYGMSVRQTMGEDGAVDDVTEMKQELAKADGHVRLNAGFWDKFKINDTREANEVDLLLYRESKAEIEALGANAALAGKGDAKSGRQSQIDRAGGITELASLYDGHKHWEKRIYRQIYNRVKQAWTAEKWIRITDDPSNTEWVGLNKPVTNGEILQQQAQQGEPEAQNVLQRMIGDARLGDVHHVENNVQELNVDIVLVDAPDFVSIRQEQFEKLADLAERMAAQGQGPGFEVLLEISDIPEKDMIKKLMQAQVDPEQQAFQKQLQQKGAMLELREKEAI